MLKIKKVLISIILSIILGYLCGITIYKIYENDTLNIINSNKVYLLQSGAYSSIDNMKMNTKQLNYVYFNDEGMYKTIVAITKNKDNIKKIKNAYNIDMVINEYYLENDDLINKINEYDKELAGTSDKEEVVKIVNNMLINYKEENNIKLVKTY